MIRAIQKTEHVACDGSLTLYLPEFSGADVEIIVLQHDTVISSESHTVMQLQEQSGFALKVLSQPAEDVWNDL